VGTVAVEAEAHAAKGAARLILERAPEIRPADIPEAALADMLSLHAEALGQRAPWLAGIGGTPFCCIPLASRDAVAGARLDVNLWSRTLPPGSWAREVYAIAGEFAPGGRLKVRMWAPSLGVPEDPATGAAAVTLAASLAAMLPDPAGRFGWTIEQGAEIGRPSLIHAEAEKHEGTVVAAKVGGSAIIVAEGQIA
jgi:trans-2,3-dihydro-3-hydroxyanthranilate isomerase